MTTSQYIILREGGELTWARDKDLNIKFNGHLPPKSKCFRIFKNPHSSEDGSIAKTSQLLERGFGQEEDFSDIIGDDSEKEVKL